MPSGDDARTKVWNQLQHGHRKRIDYISVRTSPVFATQHIPLDQLTVLTGAHSVGKTHLLRALDGASPFRRLGTPSEPPIVYWGSEMDSPEQRMAGVFSYSYADSESTRHWTTDFNLPSAQRETPFELGGSFRIRKIYCEPPAAFLDYLGYFQNRNLSASLGSPTVLRRADVERINGILGRSYKAVTWRGFDINNDDKQDVPHTEVEIDGQIKTSDQMSTGELWVHLCLWSLYNADESCLVIIDEPEAFLSPAGHAAFIDEIARLTLARGAQTVIATHSASMISRVPATMLRVLTQGMSGTLVQKPPTTIAALRILGHESGLAGIVLVEDQLARKIGAAIIARFDRDLIDRVDIIDSAGKDSALAAARILSRSAKLGVCVVLDGDQRNVPPQSGDPVVTYLPGNEPEDALLAPVRSNPQLLANELGTTKEYVTLALDSARFLPHQYWINAIADSLAVNESDLTSRLIAIWLRDERVQQEAKTVVQHIRASLLGP